MLSAKKVFFLVDSPLRGGSGTGFSTKAKRFYFYFLFVAVLLTPKPRVRGGAAKGLSGLSTKKKLFLRIPLLSLGTFNDLFYLSNF